MANLKKQVEELLNECPATRDCDQYLTLKIWVKYYPNLIDFTDPANPKVAFRDILKLPREDGVKRYRAYFQNDLLKYLPTKWEVAKQRKLNEEVWRARMTQTRFPETLKDNLEI
jgi:hypothetical protein